MQLEEHLVPLIGNRTAKRLIYILSAGTEIEKVNSMVDGGTDDLLYFFVRAF